MSYSTLPAPSDLFGVNSGIRSRVFPLNADHRSEERHSPTSEPRSPLFRPALPATELPPHLVSLYNSPYAAAAVAAAMAGQASGASTTPPAHFGHFGRVSGSFYPPMVGGETWRRPPYFSQLDMYWPGLRSLEAVVGPRTKAPREATSILKSWLNDHKDNPYPTKSEKMTLSIVTHMTLTQVSTWFANARRRIKKENKMTWTPKTRSGDRDDNSSNEEESDRDYFGRHQRSPLSRDSTEGYFPTSADNKRAMIQRGRTTIPCPPPRRSTNVYTTMPHLNGLSSDCRSQNEVNILSPNTAMKFPTRRLSQGSTIEDARPGSNKSMPLASNTTKPDDADDQERVEDSKDTKQPFIQLSKRRSYPTEQYKDPIDSRLESRHSSTNLHQGHTMYNSRSDDTEQASKTREQAMHSRNADAISSWMKEFQHLVTTGQEERARQALAAFALAAKGGAYPDIGATSLHSFRGLPQHNNPERKPSIELSTSHSPIHSNPQHSPNSELSNGGFVSRPRGSLNRSDSSDEEASRTLSNSPFLDYSRKTCTSDHCNTSTLVRSDKMKRSSKSSETQWELKEESYNVAGVVDSTK